MILSKKTCSLSGMKLTITFAIGEIGDGSE